MYHTNYKSVPLSTLKIGEYEQCAFVNCDFSEADFSHYSFVDCSFKDCNLSNIIVQSMSLKTVEFVNCKLLGVQFTDCNEFLLAFKFVNCLLDFSSFYKLKIKSTSFVNCSLKEADFTETDLSGSSFEYSNLRAAIFFKTKLLNCDFSLSENYSVRPQFNLIKKAKFSWPGIIGLLDDYDIVIE